MDSRNSNDPPLINVYQNEEEGIEKPYVNDLPNPANKYNSNEEKKETSPDSNSNNRADEKSPSKNKKPIDKKELKEKILSIIVIILYIIIDTALPIIFRYLSILFLIDNVALLLLEILCIYNILVHKCLLRNTLCQIYFYFIVFIGGLIIKVCAIYYCDGGFMRIPHIIILIPRIYYLVPALHYMSD